MKTKRACPCCGSRSTESYKNYFKCKKCGYRNIK